MSVGELGQPQRSSAPPAARRRTIRHTHSLPDMASAAASRPGAALAEDLERMVGLHDASNIAALIVEPVAGSTGILVPPIGYLQRLREICDRHGILLIFDEVINRLRPRVGAPFAAERFGVTPDIITTAKGLTNGVVPMGAVIVREEIYQAMMQGPDNAGTFPRLHLFRPSAGGGGGPGDNEGVSRGRQLDAPGALEPVSRRRSTP